MDCTNYPKQKESKYQSFSGAVHKYNHKSQNHPQQLHRYYTDRQKKNVSPTPSSLFRATLGSLLPWLDDRDDNDRHYHQQQDDGVAHPLPRVLLQLLRVLERAHALLYVVGGVRDLEKEDGNRHVNDLIKLAIN